MRTTLTLDDDLAQRQRDVAHRTRVSFKDAVNAAIRRGLSAQETRRASRKRFRTRTFRSGFRPGVDPLRLNQLSDEIEVRHVTGT